MLFSVPPAPVHVGVLAQAGEGAAIGPGRFWSRRGRERRGAGIVLGQSPGRCSLTIQKIRRSSAPRGRSRLANRFPGQELSVIDRSSTVPAARV